MSKMVQGNEFKLVGELLKKIIHFQLFLVILATFGLIAISNQMVSWFFGDGFQMVKEVMPVLALLIIFVLLGFAIGRQYLFSRNMIREYNRSVFGGAVVGLLLNLSLIPFIGIWGAVIARLLPGALVTGIRIKSLLKKVSLSLNSKKTFIFM
jgi:O-antigen/teichoic acid export membrane protein